MLKERVLTAAVMLAVFSALLFFTSSDVFALFIAVVVGIAAWEWGRLCGVTHEITEIAYPVIVGLLLLIVLYAFDSASHTRWLMLVGVLTWGAALIGFSITPVLSRVEALEVPRLLLGAVMLPIAGIAIVYLRQRAPDASPWLLLYTLALVWTMDTGAYFIGRKFGKTKLAPRISPGKTREGVYGGLLVTAVLMLCAMLFTDLASGGATRLFIASLSAAAISVVGDLFISRMKRAAGFKDSSQLLPGHGGVLDRIDGVIAALPVFVFFWIWM